jgi:hypothetical protein
LSEAKSARVWIGVVRQNRCFNQSGVCGFAGAWIAYFEFMRVIPVWQPPTTAAHRVTGGQRLWNIGGYEHCLFWAVYCIVFMMHG